MIPHNLTMIPVRENSEVVIKFTQIYGCWKLVIADPRPQYATICHNGGSPPRLVRRWVIPLVISLGLCRGSWFTEITGVISSTYDSWDEAPSISCSNWNCLEKRPNSSVHLGTRWKRPGRRFPWVDYEQWAMKVEKRNPYYPPAI